MNMVMYYCIDLYFNFYTFNIETIIVKIIGRMCYEFHDDIFDVQKKAV